MEVSDKVTLAVGVNVLVLVCVGVNDLVIDVVGVGVDDGQIVIIFFHQYVKTIYSSSRVS